MYLPAPHLEPYLEHLDYAFSFELLHARWDAAELGEAIAGMPAGKAAWVMSNHDFGRLASRFGAENADAATLLLLTLPGLSFLYQGDEMGLADGPGAGLDRFGRDRFRHPMPWGFTTGTPWLAPSDPVPDAESRIARVRELIALRGRLSEELEVVEAADGLLVLRRGEHLVAVNTGDRTLPLPGVGGRLAAHSGAVVRL